MAIAETDTEVHTPFEQDFEKDVAATQRYFDSSRFAGIIRLYTARQVVEQRGTIPVDHIVAREAAGAFYERLRELFAARKSITTFGPYSPGQAVSMKRMVSRRSTSVVGLPQLRAPAPKIRGPTSPATR